MADLSCAIRNTAPVFVAAGECAGRCRPGLETRTVNVRGVRYDAGMNDTTIMHELNGIEIIAFEDAAAWEAWLADHYEHQAGVWLKIAKKGTGIASVTHHEALDVALCYGWIDGQRKGLDETHFLQKFTPRRPRSLWSKVNIAKVEALIEAGRMRKPGFAAIEAAQADGRWDAAYESQRNATVPPDLAEALEASERARATFESLGKVARYGAIWQLMTARTSETRERRLRKLIASLEAGEGQQ